MRAVIGALVTLFGTCLGPLAAAQTAPDPGGKVALARQFLVASRHGDVIARAYAKQITLSWAFCKDQSCKDDLDDAINQTVTSLVGQYENEYATLLADRLSEDDLRAALLFANSPAGQSVAKAQQAASDDIGSLGHRFSLAIDIEVSQIFCPKHPDICNVKSDKIFRSPSE